MAKSTAISSMVQASHCGLLTSSSGGARPAFSPNYSHSTASANGHQWAASFCHTPCLHFTSLCAVCACTHACVTVPCVSAPPSERHTNRWGVERPRAILWQKRFPSFVSGADGTDGPITRCRPDQRAATIPPSSHTNEHSSTSPSSPYPLSLTPISSLKGSFHPNYKKHNISNSIRDFSLRFPLQPQYSGSEWICVCGAQSTESLVDA